MKETRQFKVGDRVRLIENDPEANGLVAGKEGTVCTVDEGEELAVGVNFDDFTEGHGCAGNCVYGRGWYVSPESLEYSKLYTIKKFYEQVQGR